MKYNVGDKVVIRKDLQEIYDKEDWEYDVVEDMIEFAGKDAVIMSVDSVVRDITNDHYTLDVDDEEWTWYENLFVTD